MPIRAQVRNQAADTVDRLGKGSDVPDLGTDVYTHGRRLQPAVAPHSRIDRARPFYPNPELVLPQPRRNIRVRFDRHVRVHAQGDPRRLAAGLRSASQQRQFGFAFHIEEQYARRERPVQLPGLLADTRKHHPPQRLGRRPPHPLQLPAGDDVKAATALPQQAQQRQRGVRFHGITHRVRQPGKVLLKQRNPTAQIVAGVHIQRRSVPGGEFTQRRSRERQQTVLITQGTRGRKKTRERRAHSTMLPGPAPACAGSAYCAFGITTQAAR